MKGKSLKLFFTFAAIVFCVWVAVVLSQSITRSTGDSRERAEHEHGIRLPPSATSIQCRGDGWLRKTPVSGGCVTTMFVMAPADMAGFLAPLHIRSRTPPAIASGDPTVNGWNVWPHGAPTYIPGNASYAGFMKSWSGTAVPVEMVSCDSPVGMWLHLEFWKLDDGMLLAKIGTRWED